MDKQPAVVVVARHGARIDQANHQWQSTAARPYDPPLTYGGWIQCQHLGARIAAELASVDTTSLTKTEAVNGNSREGPPVKKRKVIIHSSPYLRCIQTSIAISAGLRQFQQPARPPSRSIQRPSTSNSDSAITKQQSANPEENEKINRGRNSAQEQPKSSSSIREKALLRIDAFLGEWLSPSYFEHSSAPPSSPELITAAKETLRVAAEEIKGADISSATIEELPSVDWDERKPSVTASTSVHEKTGLRAMAAAGHSSLPRRPRNISFESEGSTTSRPNDTSLRRIRVPTYTAPVPTYSIAPQDAIPIGFVAHARDACIDIDLDWDSMNPPLQWGDGGPFGEEWSAMHRRFRNGLQKLMAYYEATEDEDEDEEIVLVVVTHQAGCNALIRLMTGAPALHDVGTASLTMAVRKNNLQRIPSITSTSPSRRKGSIDLGIAQEFDMKIIASTEHLQRGSNPLGLNSPRLGRSPAFASRRTVGAESLEGFSIGDPLSWRSSTGGGQGTLGRSTSLRSHAADSAASTSSGLWERANMWSSQHENTDSSDNVGTRTSTTHSSLDGISNDTGGNFDLASSPTEDIDKSRTEKKEATSQETHLPVRSATQRGLWGGESAIRRDRSPGKRRWTAIDR